MQWTKKTAFCFLCFTSILVASAASASEQLLLLDLTGTPAGKYLVTITDDGVSLQPARVLTVNPTPPPPPPSTLTERAKLVKAAAESATSDPARAETAAALAASMGEIKKLVDAGAVINYAQISAAVGFFWDQVTVKKPAAWAPCRKVVMDELAKLAQEGAQVGDYGKYLAEVGDGLTASAPGAMLAPDWSALMKMLLEIFLKYVLPLIVAK